MNCEATRLTCQNQIKLLTVFDDSVDGSMAQSPFFKKNILDWKFMKLSI